MKGPDWVMAYSLDIRIQYSPLPIPQSSGATISTTTQIQTCSNDWASTLSSIAGRWNLRAILYWQCEWEALIVNHSLRSLRVITVSTTFGFGTTRSTCPRPKFPIQTFMTCDSCDMKTIGSMACFARSEKIQKQLPGIYRRQLRSVVFPARKICWSGNDFLI